MLHRKPPARTFEFLKFSPLIGVTTLRLDSYREARTPASSRAREAYLCPASAIGYWTGALDQNTPPTQALEFHRSLLEQGVQSVLAIYPSSGHGIRGFPEVIDATTRYVGWFLHHFDQAKKT